LRGTLKLLFCFFIWDCKNILARMARFLQFYVLLLSLSSLLSRVAPNFGFAFGKSEIRPFFPNLAKFGSGQISGRIWPDLANANATAVRSVRYLITDKN